MEITISKTGDYSKKQQTIIIRDENISIIDGEGYYEETITNDLKFIERIRSELFQIMFEWKDEYIGGRQIDGEKYHIVIDYNHRKRKYKIQNKFPDNWEEFININNEILSEWNSNK